MPDADITTPHPSYMLACKDWWEVCRDTFNGENAMRAAGTRYVPLLEGIDNSSSKDYQSYLNRGTFYPAVERTVTGLAGMVMRKPVQVKAPASIDVESGITLYDEGLLEFTTDCLHQLLVVGRGGISVDWSEAYNRPYLTLWPAEAITNWQSHFENGEIVLDRVVLKLNTWTESAANPYASKYDETYRELARLRTSATTATAAARTWTKSTVNGRTVWSAGPWMLFERRGVPLEYIPFVFFNPRRPDTRIEKSPMFDLAQLNASHWRTSVDYEHGLHFTALPTPYITGWGGNNTPMRIGSGVAWLIPVPNAQVGMLEFTGQGLGAIEKALDRKERQMATVGARLLENSPNVQETAEAVRLRHAGETSALGVLSRSLSMTLTSALRIYAFWQGFTDDVKTANKITVQLNQDYLETRLTAQELDSLVKAWQAGGISGKTLYYNLQGGEIARPNVEWDEEQEEIKADEPPPAAAPVIPGQIPGQPSPAAPPPAPPEA